MSVVGCDFGSVNTVIAVARNRGVDVVSTTGGSEQAVGNDFQLFQRLAEKVLSANFASLGLYF